MEATKNSYETLFVIDPDLTEEATKAMIEKFTKLIADNGEVESVDEKATTSSSTSRPIPLSPASLRESSASPKASCALSSSVTRTRSRERRSSP